MTIDRLLQILDDWKLWMQQPSHKLGYPSKSAFLQSGGASTNDAFEIMLEEADLRVIIAIDSIIDGLPKTQVMAINARYLGSIKPRDYEHQLDMAMDNILTLASKRDLV
jgi:hypothetical protein